MAGRGARFTRHDRQGRDELVLRDGTITVDGRDRRPVEITAGDTRVRVGDARVAVRARHGVIVMVTVIAGSAEISRDGQRQRIDTGLVWEPPAPPAERLGNTARRARPARCSVRNSSALGTIPCQVGAPSRHSSTTWDTERHRRERTTR